MAQGESVWKYLPAIVGVIIGWMLFNPPSFLHHLGGISYLIMIAVGLIALIIFCGFIIRANLPKDIAIKRATSASVPQEMNKLAEDFKSAGLTQTSEVPLSVGVAPPALVIPFVNESERTYGVDLEDGHNAVANFVRYVLRI
jgi:hypothetical protein